MEFVHPALQQLLGTGKEKKYNFAFEWEQYFLQYGQGFMVPSIGNPVLHECQSKINPFSVIGLDCSIGIRSGCLNFSFEQLMAFVIIFLSSGNTMRPDGKSHDYLTDDRDESLHEDS